MKLPDSLNRLKALVNRPSHAYRPTSETFADLDVDRIAAELKLAERGKSRGEKNEPASDSETPDAVETEIIEIVGAHQKRNHDQLENQLTGYRQRLIEIDFDGRFAEITGASKAGLSDMTAEFKGGLNNLHALREEVREAEEWRNNFRTENNLRRPCKKTTKPAAVMKWLLVIALVLVELLLNGELLSKNNVLGLIGAILEAFIFSALNVGIALLVGLYGIPNIYHIKALRRIFGYLSIAVFLFFMVIVNLGLAHYREVSGALTSGADQIILERFLNAPLGLAEFRSWLLFGLGVVFSIVALIDGLSMRDLYPGYTAVDKALETARHKYLTVHASTVSDLSDVRREYEETISAARADLGKQRTEHDAIVAGRKRRVDLFHASQDQSERAANQLMRAYRDANQSTRNAPAPKRFGEKHVVPRMDVQIGKEGEWNTSELQQKITAAQTELDSLMTELQSKYKSLIDEYLVLDEVGTKA